MFLGSDGSEHGVDDTNQRYAFPWEVQQASCGKAHQVIERKSTSALSRQTGRHVPRYTYFQMFTGRKSRGETC